MGSFLSKKRTSKPDDGEITEVDKAVLSLKTQRRKINAERKRLEDVLQKNTDAIKELLAKKEKSRALLALKKKKMREEQAQNLDKWLLNVEQLLSNIEFAQQQNAIFTALRSGADAMKRIQNEVKIEDVEKLTEDTEEAKAYMDEIHEALAADSAEEVESLEEELKQLEKEILKEEIQQLPTVPTPPVELPSVPQEAVEASKTQAEKQEEPLLA